METLDLAVLDHVFTLTWKTKTDVMVAFFGTKKAGGQFFTNRWVAAGERFEIGLETTKTLFSLFWPNGWPDCLGMCYTQLTVN